MKKPRWHSCNVLQVGSDSRELWRFTTSSSKVSLDSQQRLAATETVPARVAGRDWSALWQKKLNIAWLPAEQVFLRAARFPKCDPAELLSMVELQLEKLSPLPVAQIVWTAEVLPVESGELQTVVVIVVERVVVEKFLGRLEGAGYLADRLELPILHQLIATPVEGDGIWIFLDPAEGATIGLLAWWFGGTLQTLSLLHLPPGDAGTAILIEEMDRTAWAGEFEGWMTSSPRIHLVAEESVAAVYEPVLRGRTGEPVDARPGTQAPALAELSARRATQSQSIANLLPVEFAARYRQQFIDRLWMRGLGGLILLYLAGVLIYLGALQVRKHQKGQLDKELAALSGAYTNALQLKAKARILQDQANLRFAALDSLKIVSEQLPAELTLKSFVFSGGRKLSLAGEAPMDQQSKITEFNAQLNSTMLHGAPFFVKVNPPTINARSGNSATWNFDCELRTADTR